MKKYYLVILVLLLHIAVSPVAHEARMLQADENDYYEKTTQGLTFIKKVYTQVQTHYVEEIDPFEFAKAGIEGMLGGLDPYTVFIEPEGDVRLQIITTGKYGGVGMEIGMHKRKITVISPMDNSPAKKAGIRAGDIIVKINGIEVESLSPEKISQRLRGPIGSEVKLSIIRPGFEGEITMSIIRQEIVIEDVNYAEFVQPGIAYVRLTGFTEKASGELINAIKRLQKENELKYFILDLRGNSGGLLEAAVEVANIFLDKDTPVVSTRGFRDGEHIFKTEGNPLLPDIPLAVLVDGGSASAAEIVAGALQDLDRAIVVGSETFGKGLVQKVYGIDKNSSTKIKVTTAKYYIPSGRCVQKQDYTKNNAVFFQSSKDSSESDNEHIAFYTTNQRTVYEKGGITPDRIIEEEKLEYILTELWRQSLFFDFAVKFQRENPVWKGRFEINDDIFDQFISFVREKNFDYKIEGESELDEFINIAHKKNLPQSIITDSEILLSKLQALKEKDLQTHKAQIKKTLLTELAEKYFGNKEKIYYSLKQDEQLFGAINVLTNKNEYKKILAIK